MTRPLPRKPFRTWLRSNMGGDCVYCGRKLFPMNSPEATADPRCAATRDHVHPKCLSGTNLVLACKGCNEAKDAMPVSVFTAFMEMEGVKTWNGTQLARLRAFSFRCMEAGLAKVRAESVVADAGDDA